MPSIDFIHVSSAGAHQMTNPYSSPAGSQVQADGLSDEALVGEIRHAYRHEPLVHALAERFDAICRNAAADRKAIDAIYDKAYADVDEGKSAEALNEVLHAIIDLIPPD
jgi:hypothetical protein